jgi:hypothetical protein
MYIPFGCAMLVYEVYGGDNRVVNQYLYQPSTATKAPAALVETYYSCVFGVWNSQLDYRILLFNSFVEQGFICNFSCVF